MPIDSKSSASWHGTTEVRCYEVDATEDEGLELCVFTVSDEESNHGSQMATVEARIAISACDEPHGLLDYLLPHIRAFFGDGVPR